ncbi:MAG: heavy metal translocating P-type ATPase metal-binding domain-containing protein [Flavobacteriales bacterium]|nr:heavy metal translocating P-type ATPase metal-binding domain-containing protein [Flavobacteriales bacterium]
MRRKTTHLTQEVITKISCKHCGDTCPSEPIWKDEIPFCCNGCKTVYELLHENGLADFYSIENTPGTNMRSGKGADLAYLDNPEIISSLLDFQEGNTSKVTLELPAIHCSSCIFLLENLGRLHPGVGACQVNFVSKKAAITFDHSTITLRELAELLQRIGYNPNITLNKGEAHTQQKSKLPLKIGVAGFCFGNIMLMSFPDYVQGGLEEGFARFFGYANFALAIPVLFYSGIDYLRSAWTAIRYRAINMDVPIALGMTALFLRSSFEVLFGHGLGYFDSLTGFVFFLLVGKWFQEQTQKKLAYDRDYKSYFPLAATRIVNGEQEAIPVNKVEPGDVLFVRNQEVIPADCIMRNGEGMIDYGFVTGESNLISKQSGDKLYAGGRQCGSGIEVEVIKSVDQSYLTQLWNQDAFEKEKGNLSGTAEKAASFFTWAVIGISLVTALVWFFIDRTQIAFVVTSVLIVACPCALALAMPFTYGNTMRIFGRRGLYLKNAQVVEEMAALDTLVFDKTGTLTHGQMVSMEYVGEPLSEDQKHMVYATAHQSLHPLSKAISERLEASDVKPKSFEEWSGSGIVSTFGECRIALGNAKHVGLNQPETDQSTRVYVQIDEVVKGYFEARKEYRAGLNELLKELAAFYQLHVVSGDNDAERETLTQWFGRETEMRFNQDPFAKLEFIRTLQNGGAHVAMIGDGLNDAGALKQSNVGIAVSDDLYSFSPSCAAILQGTELPRLTAFLGFSRYAVRVVKWSFGLSVLYNLVGLTFAVQGLLTPLVAAILMPLSSISVIIFTTLGTNLKGRRL